MSESALQPDPKARVVPPELCPVPSLRSTGHILGGPTHGKAGSLWTSGFFRLLNRSLSGLVALAQTVTVVFDTGLGHPAIEPGGDEFALGTL